MIGEGTAKPVSARSVPPHNVGIREPSQDCYYEYHHGTGEHILVRRNVDPNQPRFSFMCICCKLLDTLILCTVIGFLGFAGWLCYYLLNNYSGGN